MVYSGIAHAYASAAMQTKAAEATEARGLPGLCAGGYLGRTQALAEGCGGDGRGQNAAVGEKQKGAGMRGFLRELPLIHI